MEELRFYVYLEAYIVCVAIFTIILAHDLRVVDRQEKQLFFDYAIMAHIGYFISDCIWCAVAMGMLPAYRWLVALLNLSNYILMASIAFFWFLFAAASMNMQLRKTRRGMALIRLPFFLVLAALVIAYLCAPTFWVSPEGELNPLYFPLMLSAPIFYVLAAFVYSFYQASRKENAANRRTFLLIGCYPLSVVFFGIVELTAVHLPLFHFGVTVMMLFFYIQALEDRISLDPLTGLNNRGQLRRFTAQKSNLHREGFQTFLVMADANRFKQINDTYGHAEGDQALVRIADCLRAAVRPLTPAPFLARYGGDEFTLVVYAKSPDELDRLFAHIRALLDRRCADDGLPYRVTVSFGAANVDPAGEDIRQCLQRADQALYLDKAKQRETAPR